MDKQLDHANGGAAETKSKAVAAPKKGRPVGSTKLQPKAETITQIRGLGRIQCTQEEAAAVLGVSCPTFVLFLRTHEKAMVAWKDGKGEGRASLRRAQFKMSQNNPTMAIWLGKNYLNQTDRHEFDINQPRQIGEYTEAELISIARSSRARIASEDAVEIEPD